MGHLVWESDVQHAGQEDRIKMKRHWHTPQQTVRKLDGFRGGWITSPASIVHIVSEPDAW